MPEKIITNPVYGTELFQSVAPYISSIAPEVLAFELAKTGVHQGCEVKWNKLTIDTAMARVTTLQGVDFWSALETEYLMNKRARKIVTVIDHLIP